MKNNYTLILLSFSIIFSKCDKIKEGAFMAKDYIQKIKNKLNDNPKYFITSSKKKEGFDERVAQEGAPCRVDLEVGAWLKQHRAQPFTHC